MNLSPETYKVYNNLSSGMCVSLIELFMRDIYYSHDDRELLEVRLEVLVVLLDKVLADTPMNGTVYKQYYKLRNKIEERLLTNLRYLNLTEKSFDNLFNQKFQYGFKKHLLFTMHNIQLINNMRYCVTEYELEFCQYLVSPEIISRLKIVY